MAAFRISRIQLRNVRRHASLDLALTPGLTVVKGPNEAGKSTLAEAIELGLTAPAGRTAADLRTWGAQAAADAHLSERRDMLEQARRAEKLTAERDAASDRANRYAEAITVARDLATLATTHPSNEPLAILRQTVGRLTTLDGRITELKHLLEGEVQVDYEATAPEQASRLPTILGLLGIVAGIALAAAGVLVSGLTVLLGVGIGVALIGAGLVVFSRRRRSAVSSEDREKQLADVQIDRRLRGRSQLENCL